MPVCSLLNQCDLEMSVIIQGVVAVGLQFFVTGVGIGEQDAILIAMDRDLATNADTAQTVDNSDGIQGG